MSLSSHFISEKEALESASRLEAAVDEKLAAYLVQRSNGLKEAVIDFLFEYYAFRPIKLKVWSPGLIAKVEKTPKTKHLLSPFKSVESRNYIQLDTAALTDKRIKHMNWVLALQESIHGKTPNFGCYGLHEWAMLYKSEEKRHPYLNLRVSHQVLNETVQQNPLRCTHFDAYRFFTDPAIPLNEDTLSREDVLKHEQGGCIHNNMDLYKWSFKFYPWLPSELIWEAFNLALKARIVDMEASPYDVSDYGYAAIKIETQLGMKDYVQQQKSLANEASKIRTAWISAISSILESIKAKTKIANQV